MVAADIDFRVATPDDASTVAGIITEVSEGVIDHLLGGVFPGMKPQSILEMILARGSGNLDLKNILLVNVGGELAGLLLPMTPSFRRFPTSCWAFWERRRSTKCVRC